MKLTLTKFLLVSTSALFLLNQSAETMMGPEKTTGSLTTTTKLTFKDAPSILGNGQHHYQEVIKRALTQKQEDSKSQKVLFVGVAPQERDTTGEGFRTIPTVPDYYMLSHGESDPLSPFHQRFLHLNWTNEARELSEPMKETSQKLTCFFNTIVVDALTIQHASQPLSQFLVALTNMLTPGGSLLIPQETISSSEGSIKYIKKREIEKNGQQATDAELTAHWDIVRQKGPQRNYQNILDAFAEAKLLVTLHSFNDLMMLKPEERLSKIQEDLSKNPSTIPLALVFQHPGFVFYHKEKAWWKAEEYPVPAYVAYEKPSASAGH